MTTVCEKVVRSALVDGYCKSQDERCDRILDAVQRLSKYDENSFAQYLDILKDFNELRRAVLKCAETGDQLTERTSEVTSQETEQALLWLADALNRVTEDDKPAVEVLQKAIVDWQRMDVIPQFSGNERLYMKLQSAQEKYQSWLLSLPPKEILEHSYEYAIREDIMETLHEKKLPEDQAKALLQCTNPLADIFERFRKKDPSYMEDIVDAIHEQAQAVMANPQQSVGVYQL